MDSYDEWLVSQEAAGHWCESHLAFTPCYQCDVSIAEFLAEMTREERHV